MKLMMLRSVRARLLVLMTCVVVPIGLLSVILASTTYRSVIAGLEAAQIQTASNYAVRTRIWFRGSLRTLVATVASVRAGDATSKGCSENAQAVLRSMEGFQALQIRLPDGRNCFASRMPGLNPETMTQVAATQSTRPPVRMWIGAELGSARYDSVLIDGQLHLVIHVLHKAGATGGVAPAPPAPGVGVTDDDNWEATVLVDPVLLDLAFDIGAADAGSIIALMNRNGQVVVSRGISETQNQWLPEKPVVDENVSRWNDRAREGGMFSYASQVVAEPDLYVLARFTNNAANSAFTQFLVLCITPLLTLGLLFATYAWAIQTDIVRWIKGIELAARMRRTRPDLIAPVNDSMPHDIRLVAEAFNTMVAEADQRETALRSTLDSNQFLMRELNHRVKNSLQVIQSYLALSRRQQTSVNSVYLAETEAKVQVLSTAYRLALQDGSMRPVSIQPFCEEIISNLSASLRRPDQWIEASINADLGLVVDRTIPLGLGLVEAVIAGLRADQARLVRITLSALPDGHIQLVVTTDGEAKQVMPPLKIIAGLAAQIEAEVRKPSGHQILHWTFTA
jgi:two-component system, sensor histidine kinase PdtaS